MSQEKITSDSPSQEGHTLRTLRHRLLGKILELVLTPVDISVQSEVQVMSQPPKADLVLLRRKGKAWSEAQRSLLPDGIRDRIARHILLECKFTESVNEWAIQQGLGYDFFYRRTQHLKADDLQTYVVSAKTPDASFLNRLGYRCIDKPGVYVTTQPILERIVILVLNELRDEPHNEFRRLFASRQRIRKQTMEGVAQRHFTEWSDEFWAIIFGLQKVYELESGPMNKELTVDDVIEIGDKIRKSVIASASPEDRLAGLALEDRLAGLALEDRLAGLTPEERLTGLAPDEMADLLEQIETLLSEQMVKQQSTEPQSARARKHRKK